MKTNKIWKMKDKVIILPLFESDDIQEMIEYMPEIIKFGKYDQTTDTYFFEAIKGVCEDKFKKLISMPREIILNFYVLEG